MNKFMEVLNYPIEAFQRKSKMTAWILVGISIVIDSVFDPILQYFVAFNHPEINYWVMLKLSMYGVLSYGVVCTAFFIVCKCLGSKATLMNHLNTWGLTFVPTALCAVIVSFTEVFFYIFWNNTLWGMLINFVFVGILIWKTIYYIVYIREMAGLKRWRLFGAFMIMGFVILVLAFLNAQIGLKTPIL